MTAKTEGSRPVPRRHRPVAVRESDHGPATFPDTAFPLPPEEAMSLRRPFHQHHDHREPRPEPPGALRSTRHDGV
jgi:hypothetical protein